MLDQAARPPNFTLQDWADGASMPSPVLMTPLRRCGTHAIRVRLNLNNQFLSPYPLHIIDFMPHVPLYGDLKDDHNFRKLIEDVVKLHNLNLVEWPTSTPRAEQIFDELSNGPRSIHAVTWHILLSAGKEKGVKVVMDKSLDSVEFADELAALLPSMRFLNVVRDPRAQVNSMNQAIIYDFDTVLNAERWVKAYQAGAELQERYPKSVLTVRYEDFISKEKDTIQKICAFLELDFRDSMLDIESSAEAKSLASRSALWVSNASRPIQENVTKYRQHLSPHEIAIIETAAADLMQRYGYKRETEGEVPITDEMRDASRQRSAHAKTASWKKLQETNPSDFAARMARREFLESLRGNVEK